MHNDIVKKCDFLLNCLTLLYFNAMISSFMILTPISHINGTMKHSSCDIKLKTNKFSIHLFRHQNMYYMWY